MGDEILLTDTLPREDEGAEGRARTILRAHPGKWICIDNYPVGSFEGEFTIAIRAGHYYASSQG